MTDAPLIARDVHASYGKLHVLRGITLSVGSAEGAVLLGANGCGKSTLMRALNGLERIERGEIIANGISIPSASRAQLRKARAGMGYVFQQFNLVPQLTAYQNVLFGIMGQRPLGILNCLNMFASHEDRERALECLHRVGLSDRAEHRPSELSGGQQQRVAIARMLMQSPRIVIADEPIASLDPKAGREVLELLWRIVDEDRLSLLCTLHQLDLAREFGTRLIGMKAGRIALDCPAADVARSDLDALYHGQVRVDETLERTAA
ncbi:phosphonate ABC transporter ATP-binding protein [Pelagibacterium montanilacus]|uniref:phosphonate ABC transporter ATP-binding protein n=1 Tax=Pelagibacterium montanilacus TaxID=2185280 RepID=UPI000F8CF2DC|nr:ATP-binding cassette domain-containing protein [Pelagibacterium montanilacus]